MIIKEPGPRQLSIQSAASMSGQQIGKSGRIHIRKKAWAVRSLTILAVLGMIACMVNLSLQMNDWGTC